MHKRLLPCAILLCVGVLFAQGPAPVPAFEVASIKPSPPLDVAKIMSGQMHVGTTIDAARVDIGSMPMTELIRTAYRVKPYQVIGPDWMMAQRFDVLAKIPEGVSKDLVPEMLQALLAERFKLTVHRETRELPVYVLVVGKNGPKLKDAAPDAAPGAEAAAPPAAPGRGAMVIGSGENQVRVSPMANGRGATVTSPMGQMKVSPGPDGQIRMEFEKITMPQLAEMMTGLADRPVRDLTELSGTYQMALDLSAEEMRAVAMAKAAAMGVALPMGRGGLEAGRAPGDASAPAGNTIFTAIQQVGLRLEPRKMPLDTVVVDHLEKTPSEN